MHGTLKRVMERIASSTDVCLRVELSDGNYLQNHESVPDVTIRFLDRRAEIRTALFGHVGLLECYFDQTVDVEGDIASAFRAALDSGFDKISRSNPLVAARNWWHEVRFSNHRLAQAKTNAEYHYGLGTDFYKIWLDEVGMMYTCAYWKEGTTSLEQAQLNKIDHVCRKLQLQPDDNVADIGCGWGGFMFRAHELYGVRCSGFNVTGDQINVLRRDIAQRGLSDKLSVTEADFRRVPGGFDKCASIGVLEHAGKHQLDESIRSLAKVLKPGGLGVLHFIGHVDSIKTEFYIRKHIFPGGWIPPLGEILALMDRYGLEVLDVENLRRHYAPTLEAWAERFEQRWDEIRQIDPNRFNEYFRRKWRTYLVGCAEMFRSRNGRTHLFQITFSKGNVGYDYPMSRRYLYPDDSGQHRL
jgi:cyclopropane-fatty-acyl-phospholipid synthase